MSEELAFTAQPYTKSESRLAGGVAVLVGLGLIAFEIFDRHPDRVSVSLVALGLILAGMGVSAWTAAGRPIARHSVVMNDEGCGGAQFLGSSEFLGSSGGTAEELRGTRGTPRNGGTRGTLPAAARHFIAGTISVPRT